MSNPLHNFKQDIKLHSIIRGGNYFQMQITGRLFIECKKSNENDSRPLV
jgi:hypothetical protein